MITNKNLYLLSTLPFIFFILGYIVSHLTIGATTHKTPHIIGLTLQEALKLTSQNHIAIKMIAEKECLNIEPGTILTQKPTAGRLMKPHQTILVTIAQQPKSTICSQYLGRNFNEILMENTNHKKLKLKPYKIAHQMPSGTCIGQIPQQNQLVADNKIVLYLSEQKSNVYIMPNFLNQPVKSVIDTLKAHQITPIVFYNNQKILVPYQEDLLVKEQKPRAGSCVSLDASSYVQLEVI